MRYVVVQFQKRRKKSQSTLTAKNFWCLTALEDKKQKENETPRVSFSRVDVDDELMMVNVETLRQSCPQHYFLKEHLIIILNISKLSGCLQ